MEFKITPFARYALLVLIILLMVTGFAPPSTRTQFAQPFVSGSNAGIATVTVGKYPSGIAFDSATGNVYVVNSGSNSVSVINGSTNTVVANVTVGSYPIGLAFDSSNGYIYVTNYDSNTVSVINGTTNIVIDTVNVGSQGNDPYAISFDSTNEYLYVANAYIGCSPPTPSDSVSVINGSTNTVVGNITVGPNLRGVAFDASNGNMYVTSVCSNTIYVITGFTSIDSIEIGSSVAPFGVAFDTANRCVYASGDQLYQINGTTNTVTGELGLGSPSGLTFDSLNGYLYVGSLFSSNASVVIPGTLSVATRISIGSSPDVAFDSLNGDLYFSNSGSNTVSVIASEFYPTTSSSTQTFSSSSASSGFVVSILTPSGQSVEVGLTGNVTRNEISDMALSENSFKNQFSLTFSLAETQGSTGSIKITIPKSAVPGGYQPLVYIDGALATDQSYYSDQMNYYISFATQSGTHLISVLFTQTSASPTGSTSSTSLFYPSSIPTYEIIGAIAIVAVVAAGSFVLVRRRHF